MKKSFNISSNFFNNYSRAETQNSKSKMAIFVTEIIIQKLKKFMFQLGKTIVSEDILEKDFVCNLSACHGACCVDGEAGAPLSKEETKILEEIYPKVKPFLRKEGVEAIERLGTWVVGTDQDLETPLIDNKDCAYVIFDGKTALCGIEQAYNQGIINWK